MKLKVSPGATLHEPTEEGGVHKPGAVITVKDEKRAAQLIAAGSVEPAIVKAAAAQGTKGADKGNTGADKGDEKNEEKGADPGAKRLTEDEAKDPKIQDLMKLPMPELQAKGQALGITLPLGTTKDQLVRAIVKAAAAQG